MTKRTVEQLEADAKRAEQRAKELRAKAKKLTQAEEAKKNAELQAQVDEFKAFLAKEPYAQTMLDGYREYMKRKQEAETSEGDAP